MGRIVVTEFITLDGVVEDPGGEGFERGGWAFQFERGEDGDKFKLDETMASDALLLGRTTYEGFAKAWPTREGEFADLFNGMPKYVVSSTLADPEWNNSTVIHVDDLAGLKERHDRDIVVHGSATLVRGLADRGLVDELRLMVYPVVLGAGKRLFGKTATPVRLELEESRPVGPDGIVILTYRPAEAD
jgi:dihydrofolate reductase